MTFNTIYLATVGICLLLFLFIITIEYKVLKGHKKNNYKDYELTVGDVLAGLSLSLFPVFNIVIAVILISYIGNTLIPRLLDDIHI